MYKIFLILLLSVVFAQDIKGGDLDSTLVAIFGKPNQTKVAEPKPQASTIVPPVSNKQNPNDLENVACTMDSGEAGVCVRYYLCANNNVITDGVGLIDIRGKSSCPSVLDICCLESDAREPSDPITPKPDTQPQHEGCGWRNPEGVGMKTTGEKDGEAKFGEFPWMVAVFNADLVIDPRIAPVNDNDPEGQKLNVYVGGGSLIHPKVVLTAAHYVVQPKAFKVRGGEWDSQTEKEIYPYQDRDVVSKEVHKDFNNKNLFYDIALLFLATPMDMAPNVGVACLPPAQEVTPGGSRCIATGWGKDKFGKEGRYQGILKKVEVPVVEKRQCQKQLRSTRLGHFFELHSSFMCAGGEQGIDVCKGDGGSPLVCPIEGEPGRYMQSGIVAWGIGCGENGVPGVYVDVARLREWIDDKVIGQGLDPKVYTY